MVAGGYFWLSLCFAFTFSDCVTLHIAFASDFAEVSVKTVCVSTACSLAQGSSIPRILDDLPACLIPMFFPQLPQLGHPFFSFFV